MCRSRTMTTRTDQGADSTTNGMLFRTLRQVARERDDALVWIAAAERVVAAVQKRIDSEGWCIVCGAMLTSGWATDENPEGLYFAHRAGCALTSITAVPVGPGTPRVAGRVPVGESVMCSGDGCGVCIPTVEAVEGEVNGQPAWFCETCAGNEGAWQMASEDVAAVAVLKEFFSEKGWRDKPHKPIYLPSAGRLPASYMCWACSEPWPCPTYNMAECIAHLRSGDGSVADGE